MAEISELDKRLAIQEIEFKNLKEVVDEVKTHSKETFELVSGLKERLDKQNGLLPHMAEDVSELTHRMDVLTNNLTTYMQSKAVPKAPASSSKPAKWAAISAIVTAMLAAMVEVIRTFVVN